MKKWMQKLTGFVLGTFLAVSLSGKATADFSEDTEIDLPDPPLFEIVDEAGEGAEAALSDGAGNEDEPSLPDSIPDAPDPLPAEEELSDGSIPVPGDGDTVSDALEDDSSESEIIAVEEAPVVRFTASGSGLRGGGGGSVTTLEDGTYVMVDCDDDSQSITSDEEVVILAAGLNHVKEISSGIMTRIGGTGILLVEKLSGAFSLMTMDELYSEGSVALFARQEGGEYLLMNGTVPGILDEEYEITGCKLVIPDYSSLILSAIGCDEDAETKEVTYYMDGESHTPAGTCVETAGSLTIGNGAELVIDEKAVLSLNGMSSAVYGDTLIAPVLNVTGSGKLNVSGSIDGSGQVNLSGAAGSLTGGGHITAQEITVSSPGVISGSGVTFSAQDMIINGSGEIATLKLDDARVQCTGKVNIGNLNVDQLSEIAFRDNATIQNLSIAETLYLRTAKYYTDYSDSIAHTITGNIGGGGTLKLDSGIVVFAEGATLASGTKIEFGYPLVYDYAGVTAASTSPLHIQPAAAETVAETGNGGVPVVAALIDEHVERGASAEDSANQPKYTEINEDPFVNSLLAYNLSGGRIDLTELKDAVDVLRTNNSLSTSFPAIVEVMHKANDGTLSTSFYRYYDIVVDEDTTVKLNDLTGTIPADDVYLIRILFIGTLAPPWGGGTATSTTTSYTGSGILGGSGAGSVRVGGNTYNLRQNVPEEKPDPSLLAGKALAADLRVEVTEQGERYRIRAFSGDREITDLGGKKVKARMSFTLPQGWDKDAVFAVFKNADGTLTACQAEYDPVTGTLSFATDHLGDFILVNLEFDGEPFSEAFYAALRQLAEVQRLPARV